MITKQMDLFVHCFKDLNNLDKFYAVKILEELLLKNTLNIEEIYLIFNNKKKPAVRKILDKLTSNQLIQQTEKSVNHNTEKRFRITNSGEKLVVESYSNYPFL